MLRTYLHFGVKSWSLTPLPLRTTDQNSSLSPHRWRRDSEKYPGSEYVCCVGTRKETSVSYYDIHIFSISQNKYTFNTERPTLNLSSGSSRDSSVNIVTRLRTGRPGFQFPAGALTGFFSLLHRIQTGLEPS